jgi:hypothetical protein
MSLSRRRFLGGAGALIGLPVLTSLLPRIARSAAPATPKRFIAFYLPCGIVMNNWTPAAEGAAWQATPILTPLMPYRDKLLVLSGLNNFPGRSDAGGDHAAGTGSFLTCKHVKKTAGADIVNATSLDQLLAPSLSKDLSFSSLELGTDGGATVGDCDTGYSCSYIRSISWADAQSPLPKQTDPRAVFDRLFSGYDPAQTSAERQKRRAYRKSVLDYARDDASALQTKLGKSDRAKLDEYLTSIRELEQRLDRPSAVCTPGAPPGDGLPFAQRARAMIDLMAVAFACDLTRVATFMLGNGGSSNSHPQIGITEAHHELSHHANKADNLTKLTAINTWEIGEYAYLLKKLSEITDVDGKSGLDNSVVYLSSEIEDGDTHNHSNLPVLVAGGGGGTLATGTHKKFSNQNVSNLFVSLLGALGKPTPTFGDDGNAPLPGILK